MSNKPNPTVNLKKGKKHCLIHRTYFVNSRLCVANIEELVKNLKRKKTPTPEAGDVVVKRSRLEELLRREKECEEVGNNSRKRSVRQSSKKSGSSPSTPRVLPPPPPLTPQPKYIPSSVPIGGPPFVLNTATLPNEHRGEPSHTRVLHFCPLKRTAFVIRQEEKGDLKTSETIVLQTVLSQNSLPKR